MNNDTKLSKKAALFDVSEIKTRKLLSKPMIKAHKIINIQGATSHTLFSKPVTKVFFFLLFKTSYR